MGISCLFASFVLALAQAVSIPCDLTIALSCILCPVSPLLVLLTQKYTRETKKFIRAVIGWSMISSLALATSTQIIFEMSNNKYATSGFTFVASIALLSSYFKNVRGRQPSKLSPIMSSMAVHITPRQERKARSSVTRQNISSTRLALTRKRITLGQSQRSCLQRIRRQPLSIHRGLVPA